MLDHVIEGTKSIYSTFFSPVCTTVYALQDNPNSFTYDIPLVFKDKVLLKDFRNYPINKKVLYYGKYNTFKQYPYISFEVSSVADPKKVMFDHLDYPISNIDLTVTEVNKNRINKYKEHYNYLRGHLSDKSICQIYWESDSWNTHFSNVIGKNITFQCVLLGNKLVAIKFQT